ncbi:hypothetical protein GCM10010486_68770 [Nonomuraea roseoviolacea subsp. carminata]
MSWTPCSAAASPVASQPFQLRSISGDVGPLRAQTAREAALKREVLATADAAEATAPTVDRGCEQLADRIADAPVMMTGGGPSYGTTMFAAAKRIETAGVFAVGQDLVRKEPPRRVRSRPCVRDDWWPGYGPVVGRA